MNHSSLFSFEESSVWDPTVIMKRLIVPEDQLTKLNSIPGWTKIEDNQNTLRLHKDFSIEISQSECSVNVTQNNQRIEKNTVLFDEQTANRKSVLEAYKVYSKKLAGRSLSLFNISKSCENLFNSKIPKRSLSLQSICQLSDVSDLDEQLKIFTCENSAERHPPSDHSEPRETEEAFMSKGTNSETMETVPQLPVVDVPTPIENATLYSGSSKEDNGTLHAENPSTGLKQLICTADQPTEKYIESVIVLTHSETSKENNGIVHIDNADLPSLTGIESRSVLHAGNTALESNSIADEFLKQNIESITNESGEHEKNVVPFDVDAHNDICAIDKMECDASVTIERKIDVLGSSINMTSRESEALFLKETSSKDTIPSDDSSFVTNADVVKFYPSPLDCSEVPVSVECFVTDINVDEKFPHKNIAVTSIKRSNDMNLPESFSSKSSVISISAKELSFPKKEAEATHLVGNSDCNMKVNDMKSNKKECDDKTCDLSKSTGIDEASVSKKRKLESRNKRSKRIKSEEKQGNLKIRSIKKVGEICYSAEEVKTMLDIMKQLL